jgi:hypothetical protein
MKIFGNKSYLAFEIDEKSESGLRIINVWLGNKWANCDDNNVYVPSYIASLEVELQRDMRFDRYAKYLEGLSVAQIHEFIMSTRDEDSENYDLEGDQIYPYYSFMNWDETTDNISSFIFLQDNVLHITYEFWRDEHNPKEDRNKVFSFTCSAENIFPVIRDVARYLSAD